MKMLTIFTPAYNRAYTLPKLYESLCNQTFQDFEWLLVDDGSTDHTRELIDGWIKDGKINIRYIYQENAGKMTAHNMAVKVSDAELFMCVDSDDYLCSAQVIEGIVSFWDSHNKNHNCDICGIIAFKEIGQRKMSFPKGMSITHLSELSERGFKGEVALVFKSDVLKRYPFPKYPGEKFITDVYIYDQIDREYRFLLYPQHVQHCRYHEDGYSCHYMELLFANPLGFRAYHNQCVKFRKRGWLKSVICYIALSIRVGCRGMLAEAADKKLTILLFPLGILKYFFDNYRLSHL